jgi:hypothetical protein
MGALSLKLSLSDSSGRQDAAIYGSQDGCRYNSGADARLRRVHPRTAPHQDRSAAVCKAPAATR